MSDAREERTEHCHFFVLEEGLALAHDLVLNALVLGNIQDGTDKARGAAIRIKDDAPYQQPGQAALCGIGADFKLQLLSLTKELLVEVALECIAVGSQEPVEKS